jgi:hypothetical protein
MIFNPSLIRNNHYESISYRNVNLKSENNINNAKIEAIKSIKNSYLINNKNLIKKQQSKISLSKNNNINKKPIQCKLKKNITDSFRAKNDFAQVKKNYLDNHTNSDEDKNNNCPIQIINQIINQSNEPNNIKVNTLNSNNDFIIPDKYKEIDKKNNKVIKILNINGNSIAIYSSNKKEITYPDGMKQIIYDDNHQIIYYKNGDIKQIFNDGKTILYNAKEKKIETFYENGNDLVKNKNGEIDRFLNDKENLNTNILDSNNNIAELVVDFSINKHEKNDNELKKILGNKYVYNNKFKTILK